MISITEHKDSSLFLEHLSSFDIAENPYQSYAFYRVFFKNNISSNFIFYELREGGKLIAIIPIECYGRSLFGVTKMRFIGYRSFNYQQYICKGEDVKRVHEAFIEHVKRLKVVFDFYDISDATPLYNVLSESELVKAKIQLYCCPWIRINNDFETFFKETFTSSKKRTELKKFQKRLAELGDLRLINVYDEQTYQENRSYLEQIYRVHKERFANVYATSFFGSESKRAYYSELIETLMKYKKGYISLVVLDDVTIAFIFCLANTKMLIDWIPAFDPAFSKYNLGTVQYKMLLEELCNNSSIEVFDYSKGSSVYKSRWAKENTYNYQFIVNTCPGNLFCDMESWYEKSIFSFKTYLREKGVLSWIKHKMGSVRAMMHKEKEEIVSVRVEHLLTEENRKAVEFHYKDIREYPVPVREEILSSIYKGESVCGYNTSDGTLTIQMAECK